MTRTFKWRHKRVELDAERQRFASSLLSVSEEIMKVHSEINRRAFDEMMGDPIRKLNEWWEEHE